MFSTSAPYVVTVIMSVMTWALSNFYDRISSNIYLQYEVIDEKEPAGTYVRTFLFENRSVKNPIKDLNLSLLREGNGAAFSQQNVKIITVAPWGIGNSPTVAAHSIVQKVSLPAGRAFKLKFPIVLADKIYIYASYENGDLSPIRINRGFDFEVFIANYYIYIVFGIAISSMIVLALIGVFRREKPPGDQVITVRIAKDSL